MLSASNPCYMYVLFRRMVALGRLSEVPPLAVTASVLGTFLAALVLRPLVMYANDPGLRSHVRRALDDSPVGHLVAKFRDILPSNAVQPLPQ